ncbi:hypothetical protein RUND412_010137 [Rhizina undulata]
MFPAKPFDIRRKENRKWHKPRRYTVRELLLMGRTMIFCVFPMKKFTVEAWSAGIITLQDTSLNNTIPISMLQERRELRNAQFEKRHKLIHDAIMAVELNKNEVEERKEKLAARLQKEQEKSMVQDKKEGSGYSYSYKSVDLSASMFKLNVADIHDNFLEQGEGSKNDVNSGTTTRDKGKGRAVEEELDGLGQKFASSDIGLKGEIKPYSSQDRYRAAPMSFELPKDAEISLYMLKPLPIPPESNISRNECGRVQMPSEVNYDAKWNTTKLDKGKGKSMDTIPEEGGQSEGESESKNKHNMGSTKVEQSKGRSLGYILEKFPNPPSINSSRDKKVKGKSLQDEGNKHSQCHGLPEVQDKPSLHATKLDNGEGTDIKVYAEPEFWFLRRQPGFGMTAKNSSTDQYLKENPGTFINLHWNDGNNIHNPYKVGKLAMEPRHKIQKAQHQCRVKRNFGKPFGYRNYRDYDLDPVDDGSMSSSSGSSDGEVQQESLGKQASGDPGSYASGSYPAQSPSHLDSAPKVNLTTTDKSFTKLTQILDELVQSLRHHERKDFGINPTVPAAASASDQPKAPSEVTASDTTGSEKFATAPQSPTLSSGNDDQSSLEEDSLFTIDPDAWYDRTLQRIIERQEKRLKARGCDL